MNDGPRTLGSLAERERRRAMLDEPHAAPLAQFAQSLRRKDYGEVPDFDPMDGGTLSQVLFLLEKPGPKAFDSGFISRNNDDPTAEHTFGFLEQAGLPREATCLWNVVPFWNGSIKVTSEELRLGVSCLDELFGLLRHLKVVVLVGGKAQRARPLLEAQDLVILESYHPSRRVKNVYRDKWDAIPKEWAKARRFLA